MGMTGSTGSTGSTGATGISGLGAGSGDGVTAGPLSIPKTKGKIWAENVREGVKFFLW